jgi:hypothetical protein
LTSSTTIFDFFSGEYSAMFSEFSMDMKKRDYFLTSGKKPLSNPGKEI